jgi:hypothetical protein
MFLRRSAGKSCLRHALDKRVIAFLSRDQRLGVARPPGDGGNAAERHAGVTDNAVL